MDVAEADLPELLEHPHGCALALLGRELTSVRHGLHGDQLGELGQRLGHQVGDPSAQFHGRPTHFTTSADLSGST